MEKNAYAPLTNVMDLLLDAICMVDVEGRFVFVSAACERIFGYTPEEMVGRQMLDLVFPADRARTIEAASRVMGGHLQLHFENRYVRKDGKVVHIMWSARWSEADQLRIAVARDVTELKRAESMQAALHGISEATHSAEDLLALFRHIHQIIGDLLPATNFFVALYDDKEDQLSFPYFVDEHDEAPMPRKLDSGTLSAEVIRSGHALLLTPDTRMTLSDQAGTVVGKDSLDWLGVPLTSQKGVIGALVVQSYSGAVRYTEQDKVLLQFVSAQIAAVIERKQNETWLRHIARHDVLTDLPNRGLFDDRLRTALAKSRLDGERLSLIYIDLDRFKQVNDGYGHATGDLLLREVGHRIRHCVRDSDTVGRLGGDEFVVLLSSIKLPEHASIVAEKIRASLNQPFELAGQRLQISASLGVAVFPEHGNENKQLIRHADGAMYRAKKIGGNRFLVADPQNSDDDSRSGDAIGA
ncbi:diguanylate cyclase [Rhodanobacter sp. C03]|uniref:sensor domain-containing protein n=1 Tax=Rhodanobacter sp. C03 TaxID=1945858 RepID=UPI000984B4FA|nr:diguanylate cyclase [Rhodanobacter sp. C03]OOG60234.1 diguanylate cyclase [Rhodanobacter sp. C03]